MHLAALDLDPAKHANDAEQCAFTLDVVRELGCDPIGSILRQALRRHRDPASTVFLLRTDRLMSKMRVGGQRGAVEFLATGQQVVVDGYHPLSIGGSPLRWIWPGEAPWDRPADSLSVVAADAITAALGRLERSGVLGMPLAATPATAHGGVRPSRARALPATERLREFLAQHDGRVRPAVRGLIAEVGAANAGRHDAVVAIAGRLTSLRWDKAPALEFLTPLVNQAFGDGDWSREIAAALRHAAGREQARTAAIRGTVWK